MKTCQYGYGCELFSHISFFFFLSVKMAAQPPPPGEAAAQPPPPGKTFSRYNILTEISFERHVCLL